MAYEQSDLESVPGGDLLVKGLRDLLEPEITEYALLVLIAAPRLARLGIQVPERSDIPLPREHALYALLEQTHGPDAHSQYNALIRRITSLAHALELLDLPSPPRVLGGGA